jgi:hypothetical protein
MYVGVFVVSGHGSDLAHDDSLGRDFSLYSPTRNFLQ